MRSFLRSSLLVTVLCGGSAWSVNAQESGRELVLAWRTARTPAELRDLYRSTLYVGGRRLLTAVENAATDRGRPELARVYALAALYAWARPGEPERAAWFVAAAEDARVPACFNSAHWQEGDTLQACAYGMTPFTQHATDEGSVSPRPRTAADSARIVAIARQIAVSEAGSGVAGAADLLLWSLRAAPAATHGYTCTQPAQPTPASGRGLRNTCEVSRVLSRNYPALLRDSGVKGRVVLALTVGADGVVRSSRVAVPDPNDEFNAAAMRVVERMRFDRVPGAADQALTVPIRWDRAPEYPRVAVAAR